jgi:hypothetical protein
MCAKFMAIEQEAIAWLVAIAFYYSAGNCEPPASASWFS